MITSTHNPHFKQLRALHKKRVRDRTGLFLVEGEKEIAKCTSISTLYYTDVTPFVEECPAEKVQISEKLFAKIAYRDRGVIAVAKQILHSLTDFADAQTVLVLDRIEKPGNVGAILRTAKAAGIDGILLCDSPVDIFHPNTIRSSLGCVLTQRIVSTTAETALAFLQHKKFHCVIATPDASASCFQYRYKKPCAIVVGSEAQGVSEIWRTTDVETIQIPMQEGIDSLNVAVSAAIVLYCAQYNPF